MLPTRRQLRNRHGGYARALINLVAPLAAHAATDTHTTDTGQLDLFGPAASGAAAAPIGPDPEGLRRAGFHETDIEALQWAFKEIYRSGNPRRRTLEALRSDPKAAGPVLELIESLERIDRGVLGRYREGLREVFLRQGMERIRGEVASVR